MDTSMSILWLKDCSNSILITEDRRKYYLRKMFKLVFYFIFGILPEKRAYLFGNFYSAYEEVRRMLAKYDSPEDDDVIESSVVETPTPKKDLGNELLRNMYSSNSSAIKDPKLEDIMVIDVVGDQPDVQSPNTPTKLVMSIHVFFLLLY